MKVLDYLAAAGGGTAAAADSSAVRGIMACSLNLVLILGVDDMTPPPLKLFVLASIKSA
jgi:hypothetical protein